MVKSQNSKTQNRVGAKFLTFLPILENFLYYFVLTSTGGKKSTLAMQWRFDGVKCITFWQGF